VLVLNIDLSATTRLRATFKSYARDGGQADRDLRLAFHRETSRPAWRRSHLCVVGNAIAPPTLSTRACIGSVG